MITEKKMDKELYKAVINRVVKELKIYKSLKIQIENVHERQKEGKDDLFPLIIDSGIDSEMKVRQMNKALEGLDLIQRKIIEMKYFDPREQTDLFIMEELMLNRNKFYTKKKTAIEHIARSLKLMN